MDTKWEKEEKTTSVYLYEELEANSGVASLWNIADFYERFRPFYPNRSYKEFGRSWWR